MKDSGNSAFLQKDQLCYLKRAEKLTFCIYFHRTTCKIGPLEQEQKRHLFCGYKQSHQKREKGTFKNK